MKKFITVAAFYFGVLSAAQAATSDYAQGQLTGASEVDVGGTLFDVEFDKTFFDYNASFYGYDNAAVGVLVRLFFINSKILNTQLPRDSFDF